MTDRGHFSQVPMSAYLHMSGARIAALRSLLVAEVREAE